MSRPRLKVCCIASVAEAELAIAHGASALGLVSAMPSGPGPIRDDEIAHIVQHVPPPIATFLLTARTDPDAIIEQQRFCRANTLQLVDAVSPSVYPKLRRALPGVALVQVIHVTGPESVGEALDVAPFVDALLLDSGNPRLAVKELGGTGRVHDWTISRYIVERAGKAVFLAGGLNVENIGEARQRVNPFGFDLCNGVRNNGRLDPRKLQAFAQAAGI